jgi:hypothetical protein
MERWLDPGREIIKIARFKKQEPGSVLKRPVTALGLGHSCDPIGRRVIAVPGTFPPRLP